MLAEMKTLVLLLVVFSESGAFIPTSAPTPTSDGVTCSEGGTTYNDGDSWICSDGCNSCSCSNGLVLSTRIACVSCDENGVTHASGTSWTCSDGCNTCSCSNGIVLSTLIACVSCDYNGVTHASGTHWTCADGCNICFCHNGVVGATEIFCPTATPATETPSYPTGSTDSSGFTPTTTEPGPCTGREDGYVTDNSTCSPCECYDGYESCLIIDCFFGGCTGGVPLEYTDGVCCPVCPDGHDVCHGYCTSSVCPKGTVLHWAPNACCPACATPMCPDTSDVVSICLVRNDSCTDDSNCEEGHLCCENGCGRTCLAAVYNTTVPTTSTPTTAETPSYPTSSTDSSGFTPTTTEPGPCTGKEDGYVTDNSTCSPCECYDGYERCLIIDCFFGGCTGGVPLEYTDGVCCPDCPDGHDICFELCGTPYCEKGTILHWAPNACCPACATPMCPDTSDVVSICLVRNDSCTDDLDCEQGHLCCENGCGRTCLEAVFNSTTTSIPTTSTTTTTTPTTGSPCVENGVIHNHGTHWTCADGCNTCFCFNGHVASTEIGCPTSTTNPGPCATVRCAYPDCPDGAEPRIPEGRCCPVCESGCEVVRCANVTCSEGYHPEIPYRECCAVCQPDIPDECATVFCALPRCEEGEEPETPLGACCPVCTRPGCPAVNSQIQCIRQDDVRCESNGDCGFSELCCATECGGTKCKMDQTHCTAGTVYNVPDTCLTCECINGAIHCQKNTTYQSCAENGDCAFEDVAFTEGDTIDIGCESCICRSGSLECTTTRDCDDDDEDDVGFIVEMLFDGDYSVFAKEKDRESFEEYLKVFLASKIQIKLSSFKLSQIRKINTRSGSIIIDVEIVNAEDDGADVNTAVKILEAEYTSDAITIVYKGRIYRPQDSFSSKPLMTEETTSPAGIDSSVVIIVVVVVVAVVVIVAIVAAAIIAVVYRRSTSQPSLTKVQYDEHAGDGVGIEDNPAYVSNEYVTFGNKGDYNDNNSIKEEKPVSV